VIDRPGRFPHAPMPLAQRPAPIRCAPSTCSQTYCGAQDRSSWHPSGGSTPPRTCGTRRLGHTAITGLPAAPVRSSSRSSWPGSSRPAASTGRRRQGASGARPITTSALVIGQWRSACGHHGLTAGCRRGCGGRWDQGHQVAEAAPLAGTPLRHRPGRPGGHSSAEVRSSRSGLATALRRRLVCMRRRQTRFQPPARRSAAADRRGPGTGMAGGVGSPPISSCRFCSKPARH